MEILRRLFRMRTQRPFKVQDVERKAGRIGFTASSLKELRDKVAQKFSIKSQFRLVLEEDGTEIDSENYFQTLPEQTAFVILKKGEFWDGYITYLKLAHKKIMENISSDKETVDNMKLLLSDPDSPELVAILNYVQGLDLNLEAESIDEDPEWFVGVPGNLKTKEGVLKRSAKQRIRGYLNHSKDYIDNSNASPKSRKALLAILDEFRKQLKERRYYEEYFARSADTELKFCNELGWFQCEGPFNKKKCIGLHNINPYGSRDGRILFKTWNLDHRIEKSREILPKMIQAVEECPVNKTVNTDYFYDLLFSRKNLKLVDVRCHVITSHDECKIDPKMVHRKRKLQSL